MHQRRLLLHETIERDLLVEAWLACPGLSRRRPFEDALANPAIYCCLRRVAQGLRRKRKCKH